MTPQAERAPALPKKNIIKKIKNKKKLGKVEKKLGKVKKKKDKKARKMYVCIY